jgi:ATP-dependent phosphofructokinase / diphosphate-dependent phosphofructokinase
MSTGPKRIAINAGGPYVSGLNAVVTGAALAAHELGWEAFGIRDGYEGLLFRDRYPQGGLVKLTPQRVAVLAGMADGFLGTSRIDPFFVRTIRKYEDDMEGVEEIDRSEELLAAVRSEQIEGVITVLGPRALSVAWKLAQKGLRTLCVPESLENDVAVTALSLGFNSALNSAIELVDRVRAAAQAARKIAVVEVPGEHTGWLALQSGIAALADAVLIPEIRFDLAKVAERLKRNQQDGRPPAIIVVSEGARPRDEGQSSLEGAGALEHTRRALSPGGSAEETGGGRRVIEKSGATAEAVALEIQRRCDHETLPSVLGQMIRGGQLSATDRQLALAYGAAAVRGLHEGRTGMVVSFRPEVAYVPLAEAVNRIRTVPPTSQFIFAARALGISLGD